MCSHGVQAAMTLDDLETVLASGAGRRHQFTRDFTNAHSLAPALAVTEGEIKALEEDMVRLLCKVTA